jgi:hypothetical protein
VVSTNLVQRVRVPVDDLAAATSSYRALGFALTIDRESIVAATSTGSLELTSSPGARRELVLAGSRASHSRDDLPLAFVDSIDDQPAAGSHPNSVLRLERVYVVVPDVHAVLADYASALGVPTPLIERGMVIRANMAIFNLGSVGIGVATPFEDGPAARALEQRGAGLFQALFRVGSMARAAAWIVEHGLPPPARGTRNTGEQALLVPPEHAAGLYVALVGPE